MEPDVLSNTFSKRHVYPIVWRSPQLASDLFINIAFDYLRQGYKVIYFSALRSREQTDQIFAGQQRFHLAKEQYLPDAFEVELDRLFNSAATSHIVTVVVIEDVMSTAGREGKGIVPRYVDALYRLCRKYGLLVICGVRGARQIKNGTWRRMPDLDIRQRLEQYVTRFAEPTSQGQCMFTHRERKGETIYDVCEYVSLNTDEIDIDQIEYIPVPRDVLAAEKAAIEAKDHKQFKTKTKTGKKRRRTSNDALDHKGAYHSRARRGRPGYKSRKNW